MSIGKRFAELEMKLLLIEVSQNFVVSVYCLLVNCSPQYCNYNVVSHGSCLFEPMHACTDGS